MGRQQDGILLRIAPRRRFYRLCAAARSDAFFGMARGSYVSRGTNITFGMGSPALTRRIADRVLRRDPRRRRKSACIPNIVQQ
jgi:hypothetical protein